MMFGFKGNKSVVTKSDLPRRLLFVRLRWQSGKLLFILSPSAFNPGCVKTPHCRAARSTRARIERIAKSIADQVEGKNSKKNCKPWPNCHPGRIDEETLGGIEHAAPRRRWRLLAKTQKRQRRFGDDGGRDRERRLHQQRGQDIRQDMNERDSPMRVADRTRGLDIVLDLHGHHLGARQPYEYWRRRNADCDHRIAEARPQEGGERNGKNEKWAR